MTASHAAVGTGGKSRVRLRSSSTFSGMGSLLDDLQEVSESRRFGSLRMHEKYSSAARPLARSLVDNLEALLAQIVEGALDIGDTQRHMRQSSTSTVLLELLGD